MAYKARPLIVRFNEKYYVEPETGCWLWTDYVMPNGYGQFYMAKGQPVLAHRASWIIYVGPIPEGLCVLHRCDTRGCVNPTHLFLGTHSDNTKDMDRKGRRGVTSARGDRHGRTHLTDVDARTIRNSEAKYSTLMERYKVSKNTIWRIKAGKTWAHL